MESMSREIHRDVVALLNGRIDWVGGGRGFRTARGEEEILLLSRVFGRGLEVGRVVKTRFHWNTVDPYCRR